MLRCPTCGEAFPKGTVACPSDGTPLRSPAHFSTDPSPAVVPSLKSTDLPPGTKVGEFRIDQKIGEGGMGSVYAASHPLIGKKAAVKVIGLALCQNPLAVERFVQEARAANQIGHPNIVDIFSFGELPDGRSYLVMEWLPGQTLAQRVTAGPVNLGDAIEILEQMTDALEAAHEKGIIHRDLKPANVILVPSRGKTTVKLLDFGLAKLSEQDDARLQRTRTGVMMGTPEYVSPEQARGKNVDHRTDLYALGVIAYELLLGRLPFDADNVADLISQHLHVAPTPPRSLWPDIPEHLEALILGLLAKDCAHRPGITDVRAVLVDLAGIKGRSAQLRMAAPTIPRPSHPLSGSQRGVSQPAAMRQSAPPPSAPRSAAPVEPSPGMGSVAELTAPSVDGLTLSRPRRRGLLVGALLALLVAGITLALVLPADEPAKIVPPVAHAAATLPPDAAPDAVPPTTDEASRAEPRPDAAPKVAKPARVRAKATVRRNQRNDRIKKKPVRPPDKPTPKDRDYMLPPTF